MATLGVKGLKRWRWPSICLSVCNVAAAAFGRGRRSTVSDDAKIYS